MCLALQVWYEWEKERESQKYILFENVPCPKSLTNHL